MPAQLELAQPRIFLATRFSFSVALKLRFPDPIAAPRYLKRFVRHHDRRDRGRGEVRSAFPFSAGPRLIFSHRVSR